MIRAIAVLLALVLWVVPLATMPRAPVVIVGLGALGLALAGIAGRWRPPVVAAACLFALDHVGARWLAGGAVDVVASAGFGLALLFLLEAVELARCTRETIVVAGVVTAQVARWAAFAVGALATTLFAVTVAGSLVSSIPLTAAPFMAAAGALGVVLALAWTVKRAARRFHEAQ